MSDHVAMEGDRRAWKKHDDHLRAMIKLLRERAVISAAIEKNRQEIEVNLTRVLESLALQPSKSNSYEALAEDTRAVLAAPHNPDMTPAAIRQHHKSVIAIVRLLQKQIEQSARLNKVFKELYRHQLALRKMFK